MGKVVWGEWQRAYIWLFSQFLCNRTINIYGFMCVCVHICKCVYMCIYRKMEGKGKRKNCFREAPLRQTQEQNCGRRSVNEILFLWPSGLFWLRKKLHGQCKNILLNPSLVIVLLFEISLTPCFMVLFFICSLVVSICK